MAGSTNVRAVAVANAGAAPGYSVRLGAASDISTVTCMRTSADANGVVKEIEIADMMVSACTNVNTVMHVPGGVVADFGANLGAAANTCTATRMSMGVNANADVIESVSVGMSVDESTGASVVVTTGVIAGLIVDVSAGMNASESLGMCLSVGVNLTMSGAVCVFRSVGMSASSKVLMVVWL